MFRFLDSASIDTLVQQLGSGGALRLVQADPRLLPDFQHSVQQQRDREARQLPELLNRELQAAMACWPVLLNGTGDSVSNLAALPGGYTAVTRDSSGHLGLPLGAAGDRFASRTISTPGWPDITFVAMVWNGEMGVIAKVRAEGASAADRPGEIPKHTIPYHDWTAPEFTIAAFVCSRPAVLAPEDTYHCGMFESIDRPTGFVVESLLAAFKAHFEDSDKIINSIFHLDEEYIM